ncbi:LapA family protein [Streptomyces sp. SBT349]|uniref:LapA family protein n=1 Tax=Streptomyces sp. SBT349 TaxID=1580539 RepID=UPI00066DCB87|nr:LapA family protein [Streptomyces sp. SBT349]
MSTGPRAPKNAASSFWTPTRIVIAVAAVVTVLFIIGNTRRTKVRLLVPEVTMPLWLALLFTLVIGALCGMYLDRRK